MAWLCLRLEVAPHAAEALSDALLEAGAQSVSLDPSEHAGVTLRALFAQDADPVQALADALERCAVNLNVSPSVETLDEHDWVRASQAQFSPLRVGRLWVGASWHRAPEDALVVRIDPGLAFGTGSHASTRLMLAFAERAVPGAENVLDYGCGSGILAIAAAKLGARRVDAVDIDPVAVEVTRQNASANSVRLNAGLPEELRPCRYDVLMANILAQPLIELAPRLTSLARPGGAIALAGILESQADEVARAYAKAFAMRTQATEEGWALVSGRRR
jgi:ribosomal protein L11 methyltransferase